MKTQKLIQSLALVAGSLLPTQAKAEEPQTITTGKTCPEKQTCRYTPEEVRSYINEMLNKKCKITIIEEGEDSEDGVKYKIITAEVECSN